MGKASRGKHERRNGWPMERLLPLRGYKYLRDRLAAAKNGGPQVALFSTANDPRTFGVDLGKPGSDMTCEVEGRLLPDGAAVLDSQRPMVTDTRDVNRRLAQLERCLWGRECGPRC